MADAKNSEVLVLVSGANGLVVIPQPTALTRLHYFDGKLLRADDLSREQAYLRSLVHLSNQAGGFGVVHGYDVALSARGDTIAVGPGMAIDPSGRVLLLPVSGTELQIDKLIQASQAQPRSTTQGNGRGATASAASFVSCIPSEVAPATPDQVVHESSLYVITVGYAEAMCGQDDVFGKLCEEACAGSTDRPFTIDGVVFRAVPLVLQTPLPTSTQVTMGIAHLRSRVASAYFADEKAALPSLISGAGLRAATWCKGALLFCGNDVPIAVLSRSGSQTRFLDPWIARRERIEAAPRRYWAMRMAMRPWNIFLAQILQFQCQLADLLKGVDGGDTGEDPCADALNRAADLLTTVKQAVGDAGGEAASVAIKALEDYLAQAKTDVTSIPGERVLIEGGIIELPPAGYLPVTPTAVLSVNEQVRRMVGDGLDLRFCIVRPDFVPHALEEAQHMDRISLTYGLDHPEDKPQVDVLVPDGQILALARDPNLLLFRTTVMVNRDLFEDSEEEEPPQTDGGSVVAPPPPPPPANGVVGRVVDVAPTAFAEIPRERAITLEGASRVELLPSGGAAFHLAGTASIPVGEDDRGVARVTDRAFVPRYSENGERLRTSNAAQGSGWLTLNVQGNPFTSRAGDIVWVNGFATGAASFEGESATARIDVSGRLQVLSVSHPSATQWTLFAKLDVVASAQAKVPDDEDEGSGGDGGGDGSGDGEGDRDSGNGAGQLSLLLTAEFNGAADGAQVRITARGTDGGDDGSVRLFVAWGGKPLTAKIMLEGGDNNPTQAFSAKLVHDPEVIDPANTWHALALQAIQGISLAINDSLFADNAEGTLFPTLQGTGGELVVRAVRDWVLFHRRRTKTCSIDARKKELPPKRYQVFVLNDDDLGRRPPTARQVYDLFRENSDNIGQVRELARALTVVEYDGGKATLATADVVIRSAWMAAVASGKNIELGLIATHGAEDVTVLEVARVTRVEQIVTSISPAPRVLNLTLEDVPTAFDTPGTDGFILFYVKTPAPVATECQSAYAMQLPDDYWGAQDFDAFLPRYPNIFARLGLDGAQTPSVSLGEVRFPQGDASIVSGDGFVTTYTNWAAQLGVIDVAGAFEHYTVEVAFYDAFPSNAVQPLDRDRAGNIARQLAPEPAGVTTTSTDVDLPESLTCPVAAIMAVRPWFANVVAVNAFASVEMLAAALKENRLPENFEISQQPPTLVRFGGSNPLMTDSFRVADELGFFAGGGQSQPFDFLVFTEAQGEDSNIPMNNVWNRLSSRGVFDPRITNPASRMFLMRDAPFTGFKVQGARYVVLLIRSNW